MMLSDSILRYHKTRNVQPMRASQRRRLINLAQIKSENYIDGIVQPIFDKRFRELKRELRRANLRTKIYRAHGLYKVDPKWQDWINTFSASLSKGLSDIAKNFINVEVQFFAPSGKPPKLWNTDQVVQQYQAHIGRSVKDIGTDTLTDVQQAISNWYTTEQSLPDLITQLNQWFSPSRASNIAATEVANVASEVAYQQMSYMGIKQWQWDAFNDATTCDVCRDLNGQTFDTEDLDARPPNHNRCRCGILYLDSSGGPLSYGSTPVGS